MGRPKWVLDKNDLKQFCSIIPKHHKNSFFLCHYHHLVVKKVSFLLSYAIKIVIFITTLGAQKSNLNKKVHIKFKINWQGRQFS